MKVSIKEAYAIAKKALPEYHIQIDVQIGKVPYYSEPKGTEWIEWTITARKDKNTKSCTESDEMFSVALGKLCAELGRQSAKVASDVEVEEPEKPEEGAEVKEDPTTKF